METNTPKVEQYPELKQKIEEIFSRKLEELLKEINQQTENIPGGLSPIEKARLLADLIRPLIEGSQQGQRTQLEDQITGSALEEQRNKHF